jgi:hypothetical protein
VESTSGRLFRGSELPRLLILAAIMVVGWGLVWQFAQPRPAAVDSEPGPVHRAGEQPEPAVPDRSEAFETVTDRTPMSFRDNAAYARLVQKAREKTPAELAAEGRRDVALTHLWERPELYRGVPVHLLGTARRVLRYESKLSRTGWLYEAWIYTPEASKYPFCCAFEEPPAGFPVGTDLSERVVFNGYFLKIMKYQADDVPRGAPVLVGKLGWDPRPAPGPAAESNRTLFWSLVVLGGMFFLSLARWIFQLSQFLSGPRSGGGARAHPSDEIPADDLSAWVESVARNEATETEEHPYAGG